jgi:hypothetical protein
VNLKTAISHIFFDYYGSGAIGSSILECQVYAKPKIGNDNFIGGTKDTFNTLLIEGASEGLYTLFLNPFRW